MRTVTRGALVTAAAVLLAISIHQVALAVSLDRCEPRWGDSEQAGWIAWDGQTLNDQSYQVRVLFYREWGEQAGGRWRWEHNCKTRAVIDEPEERRENETEAQAQKRHESEERHAVESEERREDEAEARDATTAERPKNEPDPTPRGIFGDAPYTVFDVEQACREKRAGRSEPSDKRFEFRLRGIHDAKTGAALMGCE